MKPELIEGEQTMTDDKHIIFFLYLLMRDHVPTGIVASIISQLEDVNYIFSNKHLENMATEYASLMTETKEHKRQVAERDIELRTVQQPNGELQLQVKDLTRARDAAFREIKELRQLRDELQSELQQLRDKLQAQLDNRGG